PVSSAARIVFVFRANTGQVPSAFWLYGSLQTMNARRWWTFASLAIALLLVPLAHAADFYIEDLRIPMAAAGPPGLASFLTLPAAPRRSRTIAPRPDQPRHAA